MAKWFGRWFGGGRGRAGGGGGGGGGGPKDGARGEQQGSSPGSTLQSLPHIPWIDADQNPWGVPVLDVRPVTRRMLSTSTNPQCAVNAISFGGEDGTCFIGVEPEPATSVPAALRYPIDRHLADGALFLPREMEQKWAIFLHRGRVIFVRSWTRQVTAVADVEVADGIATLTRIYGSFRGANGDDDATAEPDGAIDDAERVLRVRTADFLIRTHALGTPFPAPIPPGAEADPRSAAMGCMSWFGDLAEFATPHAIDAPPPSVPLRTHSLLHIAVARGDRAAAQAQLDAGVPIDLLAGDGLAPLHWSMAAKDLAMAEFLLDRGSPADVRSAEGATPLMNAVQAGRLDAANLLLARGADPNARDTRGFTALHRAAEMGKPDIVQRLLDAGASARIEAGGHTPLSVAQARGEAAVVSLLTRCG
jgi:hypothetical protein